MKEKTLTLLLCIAGILMISCGLYRDDDFLLVSGLVSAIGGYLKIRRKLKETADIRSEHEKTDSLPPRSSEIP